MQPTDKFALRKVFGAQRRERTAEHLELARSRIRRHILDRCTWSSVAAYAPMRTEPGSHELLDELHRRGTKVLVPRVLADNDLDWTPYPSGDSLGVDAIAAVDVVLVPALAVARDGTRLGRGGGSYDRALKRVAADIEIVALLFDGELVDELPSDDWDMPVTAAVTPSGWRAVGESWRTLPG